METEKKQTKNIQSIHKALDILEFLVQSGDGQKLSTIASHCGLNKTTAFHIVKTLEARGYIEQSPDSLKYKSGGALFALGTSLYKNVNLTPICKPYMEQLYSAFHETVSLYHYSRLGNSKQALCVYFIESDYPVRATVSVGKWQPLYCTAVGKLYLAALSKDALGKALADTPIEALTPHTVNSREALEAQLREIKSNTVCMEREEAEEGVVNIAVPIFKYSGRVLCAICVTIPIQRATEGRLQEISAAMLPVSQALSALSVSLSL